MNYARFFSILRSPSTPYLAACLMFKHVEAMRKTAFRIFAKTYGGRTKDGEIAYDSYPLRRLTGLLCYEDDDETRAACHHYNITVVEEGRGRETINWKQTPFREPKDPEKGTVILLRPRKMMKTIESKLKGATRLGVCRGELSGEGSFLLAAQVQPVRGLSLQNSVQAATSGTTQAQAEALGIQKMEDEDRERNSARKRQDEEESQRIEDERRQKESAIRQFSEQEQQKVEAKARQLQIQLQEESARRVQEEIERKRLEREHEAKRLEMEQMAVRKVAAELVRQREQEAAELKEALRQEEEARVWEEAEKQRQAEEHHRQELERKKRQEELDAELLRQEVESRRLEHLKEQGNERLRREMAALKLRQKLKEREDAANKILVWKLLKDRTARLTIADRTKATLIALKSRRSLSQAPYNYPAFPVGTVIYQEAVIRADLTTSLESELSERQVDCKLNDMLTETARIALEAKYFPSSKYGGTKSTILFKVAVLFPQSRSSQDQVMSGLVLSWIQSQLDFDKVSVARSTGLDVRVVVVDGSTQSASSVCDVALLVVPPPWSDLIHERIDDLKSLSLLIDADVPRIILALCECFEPLLVKDRNILFPSVFSGNFEEISIVSNVDVGLPTLKQSLLSCVDCLARAFVFYPPRRIERLSIGRIFFKCLSEVLWQDGALEEREDIVLHACAAMHLVINEIDTFCANILQTGYLWPSSEFAGDGVPGYFGENANLPLNWAAASLRHHIEPEMMRYVGMLDRPFSEIIELLVRDGNPDVQLECGELLDNRLFRRCLQTALLWRIEVDECEVSSFVYLPLGQTDEIVRRAATTQLADGLRKVQNCLSRSPLGDSDALVECIFIEEIDRPPQDTPIATREKLASKRPWTDSVAAVRTSGRSVRTATPRSFAYKKRQRMVVNSGQRRMSQNMAESISFTKRVMRLLGGEVKDMILGNGSLSSALKGAPPLNADIGIPPS